MKLFISALIKLLIGLGLVTTLLFVPAGTLAFSGAWRLIALLFIPMVLIGTICFIWAPETLKRRLRSKEERSPQKGVVAISGLLFVASFVLAGLDFRFGWSDIPSWINWISSTVFLLSYGMYAEVMRENEWLSRSIEIMEGQKVVSTGLYGVVRHPMYTATIFMFLSMPLVMGSWWAFIAMLPYVITIIMRVKDEESLVIKELEGYSEYKQNVKWKLIPFIW